MSYNLWVTTQNNETIELTHSPYFEDVEIDFLNVKANINSDELVNMDGGLFNSAYVPDRPATITIQPDFPVEENRQRIFKYFKAKKPVTIRYKNNNRDVNLYGYVESIDGSLFESKQKIIVNLKCLKPNFYDIHKTVKNMSQIMDMFEFPFSTEEEGIVFSEIDKTQTTVVFNAGEVDTGVIIELTASGTVVNPTIYNAITRESFGLSFTMQIGDLIRINTSIEERSIELVRDGITTNIINSVLKNPDWFTLETGDNVFTYACEDGEANLSFKFIFTNQYVGV